MPLTVADRWFDVTELSTQVTLIDEIHIRRQEAGNIWFLPGSERCLVFDTGTGLGDLPLTISKLTDKPVIAIASTGYYDHAGGLHQFKHRAVHSLEAARVSKPTRRNTVSDKYFSQRSVNALPYAGFLTENYDMRGAEPTQLLDDGTKIEIGDRSFEVLHIPGVTAGSIALYEEQTGFLFSGESLSDSNPLYVGEPADECDDADSDAHRASMQRLLNLKITTVYPGHHQPFAAQRMQEIFQDHLGIQ